MQLKKCKMAYLTNTSYEILCFILHYTDFKSNLNFRLVCSDLKYIVENFTLSKYKDCIMKTFNHHSKNGHLKKMQWLYSSFFKIKKDDISCSNAFKNALLYSNCVNTIKWLYDLNYQNKIENFDIKRAVFSACEKGNIDILKFLDIHFNVHIKNNIEEIFKRALISENTYIVEWLVEKYSVKIDEEKISFVLNKLNILKWLHRKYKGCLDYKKIFEHSLKEDHYYIMRWSYNFYKVEQNFNDVLDMLYLPLNTRTLKWLTYRLNLYEKISKENIVQFLYKIFVSFFDTSLLRWFERVYNLSDQDIFSHRDTILQYIEESGNVKVLNYLSKKLKMTKEEITQYKKNIFLNCCCKDYDLIILKFLYKDIITFPQENIDIAFIKSVEYCNNITMKWLYKNFNITQNKISEIDRNIYYVYCNSDRELYYTEKWLLKKFNLNILYRYIF